MKGCGKARAAAAIRKSGHLDTGTSLFFACGRGLARKTPEEGSCSAVFVFLFSRSCFSLLARRSPDTRRTLLRPTRRRRFTNPSSSPPPAARFPSRRSARRSRCSTASEIEQRHALSTIDLLRTVPGIVAVRSGGVGNLTGVFVRGGESTYNKVLLDGMPLNEPGGAFNFASLSPENIERIEVLRGAHSALFGSDAMASVIQLFSVRPETRPASAEPDRRRRQLQHEACLGGCRRASGAGRVLDVRLAASDGQSGAEQQEHRRRPCLASVTRALKSGASARLLARGEFGRTGAPGTTAFGRPDMDAFFRNRDGSVLGGWNQPIGSRMTQQTSYSYIVDEVPIDEPGRRCAVHAEVRRSGRRPFPPRIFCTTPRLTWRAITSSTAPMRRLHRIRR